MAVQAIEAASKDGNLVLPADQDAGDITTARRAVHPGASVAYCPTDWRGGSNTMEGSGETSRTVARGCIAAGACVLWLLIGAVGDKGLCGESNTRAGAFGAPTEKGREAAESASLQDMSLQVLQVAETTGELKQPFEQKQPWDRDEALKRALTSSLREELDVVRAAAEVARIKQTQALDRERDRADTLARELEKMRIVGVEAVQAIEAEIKQRQALEQERGRADTLERELTSLRAELDAVRIVPPEASRATDAKIKQRQALEQTLKQERDRADTLARERTSLRAELDTARAASVEAAQAAEAAKVGQKLALDGERDKAATLARELALARKVATGIEQSTSASAASHFPPDEQRLLARASALLRQADISGARSLLEHALERGSARAAFMLAETYDVSVLQSWGARGISGDLTKAPRSLSRAQAGGIEDAKGRIEALQFRSDRGPATAR